MSAGTRWLRLTCLVLGLAGLFYLWGRWGLPI